MRWRVRGSLCQINRRCLSNARRGDKGRVPLRQLDFTPLPQPARIYSTASKSSPTANSNSHVHQSPAHSSVNIMGLDVTDFITEKGGNPELIKESQRKRFASVEVVDEVIALYEDHRKSQYAALEWPAQLSDMKQPNTRRLRSTPESMPSRRRSGK